MIGSTLPGITARVDEAAVVKMGQAHTRGKTTTPLDAEVRRKTSTGWTRPTLLHFVT